jgi:ATP-dependent DNA ligase
MLELPPTPRSGPSRLAAQYPGCRSSRRVLSRPTATAGYMRARRPERLAYFAFDLLHLDGHDLRRCPLEDRKAILRDVIGAARCDKHDGHRLLAIVAGDTAKLLSRNGRDRTALFREPFRPLAGAGLPPIVLDGEIVVPDDRGVTHIDALSEAISFRQVGAEGIVSKRSGSIYRGGESRDWIKAKVFATGAFVVTAFGELGDGRLEALYVAKARAGKLVPVGSVKFGLSGKGLRNRLDALRSGLARSGFVPVRPELVTRVKYFGRYRRGWIRDGVLLSVEGVDHDEKHG